MAADIPPVGSYNYNQSSKFLDYLPPARFTSLNHQDVQIGVEVDAETKSSASQTDFKKPVSVDPDIDTSKVEGWTQEALAARINILNGYLGIFLMPPTLMRARLGYCCTLRNLQKQARTLHTGEQSG